jgi:hypothetical protein
MLRCVSPTRFATNAKAENIHDEKMLRKGDNDSQYKPFVDPGLDNQKGLSFRESVESVEHLNSDQDGK